MIYNVFAGLNFVIGIISGSHLIASAWKTRHDLWLCILIVINACAVYWIGVIYLLSLFNLELFAVPHPTIGIWIRPVMPILLLSPSILVRLKV